MKTAAGEEFTLSMTFNGILPAMPDTGYDFNRLAGHVNELGTTVSGNDTYWGGKSLGKFAAAIPIADFVGNTGKRDGLLQGLKTYLEEWFTAGGTRQFYYHAPWSRLIGYPSSFGTDSRLSDQHFHYGYFIMAAATIARFDPSWAKHENWGGMVEMLIRDVACWDDNDPLFGRFGYFDPYEGHGWADGLGSDASNNEESSSEAMNLDAALIYWGMLTGNQAIRDQGIFQYVNEARATEQYWWDVDEQVFPSTYPHTCVGRVWGDGGDYGTWFSGNVSSIHGINFLPITGSHLYIGRHPDYIPKNYNEGFNGGWSDLFYGFLAFCDADLAAQRYGGGVNPENGESKAHTYQHIMSLKTIGRLSERVVGDIPTCGVFEKDGMRTYAAFNPADTLRTVHFLDGYAMDVPPRTQIHQVSIANPNGVKSAGTLARRQAALLAATCILTDGRLPAPERDVKRIEVYDLQGKKLWQREISQGLAGQSLRAPGLRGQGMYVIKSYR
jgi:hypothetical protein